MSVYTLLSQNQLRDLLEKYELGKIESIEEIPDGIENSNYMLRAWQQDYVLTIFEQHAANELNPFFKFMMLAEQQGFAFPCPLLNKSGKALSFFEYKGKQKHFIVCKKLQGAHPAHIDTELCKELGLQFAAIHLLSTDENVKGLFPFDALDFVLPDSPLDFLSDEKQSLLAQQKLLIQKIASKTNDLPSGICHCDFFPDNSLVSIEEGKPALTGFLDWYDARNTFFILDLAIIAVSWCKDSNNTVNGKLVVALLEAYDEIRPLEEAEKDAWNDFLKIASCIFWLSREVYAHKMKLAGKEIKATKQSDEFYQLLLALENN